MMLQVTQFILKIFYITIKLNKNVILNTEPCNGCAGINQIE